MLLEMFCRAFLSEQAASAYAGRYGDQECVSSGDCSPGECQRTGAAGSETDSGPGSGSGNDGLDADSDSRQECVRGRCGCPSGFHHIALDVGLER